MTSQSFLVNCSCIPYSGNLSLIKGLEKCVIPGYEDLFKAAIVHGSVATAEDINYSDFDGLLIIKDRYKNSVELKQFIKKSMKRIYQFDPLQHHGWFIIYESQLQNYPQTYFPYELFEFARMIYPKKTTEFDIKIPENVDYIEPLVTMSAALLKKIENNFVPQNMFQLKGFLSQILLLPALYVQAREKIGIFKKFSFELASKDFGKKEWEVIDTASAIRQEWSYSINKFQKIVMYRPEVIFRKATQKIVAPAINKKIQGYLDEKFYSSLAGLICAMRRKERI